MLGDATAGFSDRRVTITIEFVGDYADQTHMTNYNLKELVTLKMKSISTIDKVAGMSVLGNVNFSRLTPSRALLIPRQTKKIQRRGQEDKLCTIYKLQLEKKKIFTVRCSDEAAIGRI